MISPSQRPLPDNTQHSQHTNILALGGIRTHDRSRWAAVDLRLRPRGHWDRHYKRLRLLKLILVAPNRVPSLQSDDFPTVFFCGGVAQRGPWPPLSWGSEITDNGAPQSVGLLWTSDQPVAKNLPDNKQQSQHTDIHVLAEFEPTISAGQRPVTCALERAETVTSPYSFPLLKYNVILSSPFPLRLT